MPRLDDVTVPPGVGTGLIAGRVTRPATSGVLMAVFGPAHAQQQMPVLVPWAPDGTPLEGSAVWAERDDRGQLVAIGVPGGAPVPYDTSPIGSVMTWSGRSNPSAEYALANGQTLARDDFPDGYAFAQQEEALGNPDWTTTSTTFTVPNYVGRFLFHRDVQAQGYKDGTKTVTLTGSQSGVNGNGTTLAGGQHEHDLIIGPDGHTFGVNWGSNSPTGSAVFRFVPDAGTGAGVPVWTRNAKAYSAGSHSHGLSGRNASEPHNNMPPYVAVAMFVKVAGVTVSAGAIVGPSGVDGKDGAPGGASGYHVADATTGCTIPSTGPAGRFLVRGGLIIQSSGGYYVAVDVEISSGGVPLWTGTLSASDLGAYLPMSIMVPEQVLTLGAGAELTFDSYSSVGSVTETWLTALAFHDLA